MALPRKRRCIARRAPLPSSRLNATNRPTLSTRPADMGPRRRRAFTAQTSRAWLESSSPNSNGCVPTAPTPGASSTDTHGYCLPRSHQMTSTVATSPGLVPTSRLTDLGRQRVCSGLARLMDNWLCAPLSAKRGSCDPHAAELYPALVAIWIKRPVNLSQREHGAWRRALECRRSASTPCCSAAVPIMRRPP